MNILTIIPVRGGSKGIPRKNLIDVNGKPLMGYTIDAALAATSLSTIWVSTDDQEMYDYAERFGVESPGLRPSELAEDESPTWACLQYTVEQYEALNQKKVDAVLTLQATAPLRTPQDIDEAVEMFKRHAGEATCLISVCKMEQYHPLTLYFESGSLLKPLMPSNNPNKRRQEFSTVYWRNGAIYITSRDLLFQNKCIDASPIKYVMDSSRSVNIDDLEDLEMARYLLSKDKSASCIKNTSS